MATCRDEPGTPIDLGDGPHGWTPESLQAPHRVPDKATRVRRMFDAIAPRYELVNTLFSGGRDAAWRRHAVKLAGIGTDDAVLDVACGTGDFARTFDRAGPCCTIGVDFSFEMLRLAAKRSPRSIHWCLGDALTLPFPSKSFTVVSCAFGVRNFQDTSAGLREFLRVLAPGGRAVILEFTMPRNPFVRVLNHVYAHRFMPVAAALLAGDHHGAYRYLSRSIASFDSAEQMCRRLRDVGFNDVSAQPLTMGIVTLYLAHRIQ